MTFDDFSAQLKTAKPEAQVYAHGAFANGATKNSVELTFAPGGKVYSYRGSYAEILAKFGIEARWYVYNHRGENIATAWTEAEAQELADAWVADYNSPRQRELRASWGSNDVADSRIRYW